MYLVSMNEPTRLARSRFGHAVMCLSLSHHVIGINVQPWTLARHEWLYPCSQQTMSVHQPTRQWRCTWAARRACWRWWLLGAAHRQRSFPRDPTQEQSRFFFISNTCFWTDLYMRHHDLIAGVGSCQQRLVSHEIQNSLTERQNCIDVARL